MKTLDVNKPCMTYFAKLPAEYKFSYTRASVTGTKTTRHVFVVKNADGEYCADVDEHGEGNPVKVINRPMKKVKHTGWVRITQYEEFFAVDPGDTEIYDSAKGVLQYWDGPVAKVTWETEE